MSIEADTTMGDDIKFAWLEGPQAVHEEEVPPVKNRLPKPLFVPSGKRVLCYQDQADEKVGRIYVPKDSQKQRRPCIGPIVGIGDGYEPDDENWLVWNAPDLDQTLPLDTYRCPYEIGQRVLWSKYDNDMVVRVPVEDDWWDSEEEKKREDGKVEMTLLHVKQVLGVFK